VSIGDTQEERMGRVTAYHRPDTVPSAVRLLADGGRRVLAGGTVVVAEANSDRAALSHDTVEVVDIQALGLAGVEADGAAVRLGAATTLATLAEHAAVPELMRRAARAELPSTLRAVATVGGTVAAADPDSRLLAALLVHDAAATVATVGGTSTHAVSELLARPELLAGALVTDVTVTADAAGEAGAIAATGRTPADVPIVAAVGRRLADGTIRVALTGVAATPVVADDPAAIAPAGDFRGTAEYRRHLAVTLTARVRQELQA
jgi:CO/xanthine dehydrogenase FAD-binding subunit